MKGIQAKDVPDAAILAVVAARHPSWAHQWDMQEAHPGIPPKVLLAKCRSLIKRGVIDGCPCGCRGDFRYPDPA